MHNTQAELQNPTPTAYHSQPTMSFLTAHKILTINTQYGEEARERDKGMSLPLEAQLVATHIPYACLVYLLYIYSKEIILYT